MLSDFCLVSSLLRTDLKTLDAIVMACSPDKRITAIAPAPDGVASATIVSCGIIVIFY